MYDEELEELLDMMEEVCDPDDCETENTSINSHKYCISSEGGEVDDYYYHQTGGIFEDLSANYYGQYANDFIHFVSFFNKGKFIW